MNRLITNIKKASGIVLILLLAQSAFSQKNFTLYHLNETSQAINVNPGFKQKNRVYVSLPLGYQNISAINSGFRLNDVLQSREQDDSLYISPALAISKMAKTNFLNIESTNELLGLGFKIKKGYLSFNISNRFQTRLTYPKDLFLLGFEGNGQSFLGQRASIDGLGLDMMSFFEYGIGYNRSINDKLTVGGRLKLLSGIANIQTKRSELGLYTDASSFDITIDGAMQINTSNISQFMDTTSDVEPSSLVSSLFNFKNSGFAFDLGATYQMNEKIQFSTSLLDLGTISWKSNVTNYASDDVNYTFKGIDLNQVIEDSLDIGKVLSDTLTEIFALEETSTKYRTALHTKFYLGGQYKINKNLSTGLLMYNEIVASKYSAGVSVSLNAKLKNWLSASVNYSAYARSYNNIGFGLNLKGGPIQAYVMTDNILAMFNPAAAKHVHISTGINIVIGPRKDKDNDGIVDKKDSCPEEAGLVQFLGCPDRDNDSIPDKDDACPDVAGLVAFKGCPDKDLDGVQDKEDECPEVAGLVQFKGCPDQDKDSIRDKDDECPEIAGLALFKGCPDTDGDGIKDADDACPDVAGSLVNDGCPDTDLDGVLDYLDNCPTVYGPKENMGCPWPDTDGDGLLDSDDSCPYIKGPIQNKGCPYEDTDGDGILDSEDQCPSVKGVLENHGCPKIEAAEQEILKTAFEALEFNVGNAVIKNVSNSSLNDLSELLKKKPTYKLQVAGHTDNVGNEQANMILSKKRAEAIQIYLVSKGIDKERVKVLFFGETKPIASNDTEEGRQKNRRVEMTVVFE